MNHTPPLATIAVLTVACALAAAPPAPAAPSPPRLAVGAVRAVGTHPIAGFDGQLFHQRRCRRAIETADGEQAPLAASVGQTVHLEIDLLGCPARHRARLPSGPMASCRWAIEGADGVAAVPSRTVDWQGWRHTLALTVPDAIGVYTLLLRCTAAAGADREPVSDLLQVSRPLFVTLAAPQAVVSPPAVAWYRSACSWAAGHGAGSDEMAVVADLLRGFRADAHRRLRYGSFELAGATRFKQRCSTIDRGRWCACPWQALVTPGDGCNFANCYQFSEVVIYLAATLGIGILDDVSISGLQLGDHRGGFATSPHLEAFDPSFEHNVACREEPCPNYLFLSHSLAYRDGRYFDATFDATYEQADEAIYLRVDEEDEAGNLAFLGTDRVMCRTVEQGYGGWSYYRYPPADQRCTTGMVLLTPSGPPARMTVKAKAVQARLGRGKADLLEHLLVRTEMNLPAGSHALTGQLLKGDQVIANGSEWEAPTFARALVESRGKKTRVRFLFSGESIYRSGLDGPYALRVRARDANGLLRTLEAELPCLKDHDHCIDHVRFGEVVAGIDAVAVERVDGDHDGVVDQLRIDTVVSRRGPSKLGMQARLATPEGTTLAYGGKPLRPRPSNRIAIEMPVTDALAAALDHTAVLTLQLHHENLFDGWIQPLDSCYRVLVPAGDEPAIDGSPVAACPPPKP